MVSKDQWCNGQHTPEQIAAAQPQGFLARLFSR
jgi:hypothetical protein